MMNSSARFFAGCVIVGTLLAATGVAAQDWPQWRGENRDGKATGFEPPSQWPEQLNKKWEVVVGDGVATPSLVDEKVFVFSRQDGNEILRCLALDSGEEIWQDKYPARGASGPAAGFAGPRSSPTVVAGKVLTLGANGTLSCLDADSGEVVWRKTGTGDVPQFFTSSSPLITNGLCIVQIGGENRGAIAAYDLDSGEEKWNWSGDGTAYASPVLCSMNGTQMLVALTAGNVVGLSLSDGALLWQIPYEAPRRGYNASTPIVKDDLVIFSGSGRGTKAVKLAQQGDRWSAEELWVNDNSVQYNTPVLTAGPIIGISDRDTLFCIDAETGETAWTSQLEGRGRLRGYGSVVDGGSIMAALNPTARLVFFEPTDEQYKQVAGYQVSSKETFAYPVLTGKRVLIKDDDTVTLWSLE